MRAASPNLTPLALAAFSALLLSLLCAHAYAREGWDATALAARESWLDDGLFSRWHDDELAARDVEDDGYDYEYDGREEEEDGWGEAERRDADDNFEYRRDLIMNELAARQGKGETACVNRSRRIKYKGSGPGCDQSRSLGYASSHNCKGKSGSAYYCVRLVTVPGSTSQGKSKGKGKAQPAAPPTTTQVGTCYNGKSKLAGLNMEGGECFN